MSPHQSHFTTDFLHRPVCETRWLIRSARSAVAVAVIVVVMLVASFQAAVPPIIVMGGPVGGASRNIMTIPHAPLDYFRSQGHRQQEGGRRSLLFSDKGSASKVGTERPTMAAIAAQAFIDAASEGDFSNSDGIVDAAATAALTSMCVGVTGGTGLSQCAILAKIFGPHLKGFLDGVMHWFASDDVEMIVQASPIHGAGGDALWAYYKSGDWEWSDDAHLRHIARGENKEVYEDLTGGLLKSIELRAVGSDEVCVQYVAWVIGKGSSHTGEAEVIALSAADLNALVGNEANFDGRAEGCVWFGKSDRGDIKSIKFSWSVALWCIENRSRDQLVECMKNYAIDNAEVTTGYEQAEEEGWFSWWGK